MNVEPLLPAVSIVVPCRSERLLSQNLPEEEQSADSRHPGGRSTPAVL